MSVLLDANILIALVVSGHVHHGAAEAWLMTLEHRFATCPITEGCLTRLLIRQGEPSTTAQRLLSDLAQDARHEFWPAESSYRNVPLTGVLGHRQVTDAYLAHLARLHDGRLATFDKGLASQHADVAILVPTRS